jgi:C_GCAxxG_C_C family probable redox protein
VIAVGGHYLRPMQDLLIRVSCPFGGGVGGTRQEICGALSGGVIVLGALWGRATSDQSDDAVNRLSATLRERFLARYGSTICQPVREIARDEITRCLPVVEESVRLLVDVIEDARRSTA